MKEEHNSDREILLFRYALGVADEEEKNRVEELVADSKEVVAELDAVKEAISLRKKIHEMESYDITSGYKDVRHIIRKNQQRNRIIRFLSRTAAILTIPLLITTLIFGYLAFHKTPEEIVYVDIVSAPGLVSRFELPDKSKVWLNSNATLRYPVQFDKAKREVKLTGEGYFEVQSDKEHPFYVTTASGMKIMAYGTQFNVNTKGEVTETTLAEGKVSVFYNDQSLRELNPGEQVSYYNETGQLITKEVSLYEKLAWKDGKIIFRNAPLDEVFEQLSKRYHVDIVLHDEHNQSGRYLSRVTFTDETIQQIFSYLEIAAPIEWKVSTPVKNQDSTLTRQKIEVWLKKK